MIEESLKRLEEIVEMLEGEISLEKSLELFEEGIQLASTIKRKLEESELRIKKVLDSKGFKVEDFNV
jgi:exodeoxyribonuclease VII small subunit